MAWAIVFWWCHLVWAASGCNTGWFGSSCQYKCHCANNRCDDQGLCLAGSSCERGWFGPLCQYQDLSNTATITPASTSHNFDNGNNCSRPQSLKFVWQQCYEIRHIRIKLGNSDSAENIIVSMQKNASSGEIRCRDQKMFRVNNNVTDIYCNVNQTVQILNMTFGPSTSVCSININGGRNVALKQTTWQSSNYSDSTHVYSSTLAVDGNTNAEFSNKSCTHTAEGNPGVWRVTFTSPVSVNRYVLYNRNKNPDRLAGFKLVSYSSDHVNLYSYTDSTNAAGTSVVNVSTIATQGVSYVNITARDILTLCEVEIYEGCLIGWFGPSCQYKCHCTNNYCDVSGECYGGSKCDRGWFGPLCQYQDLATLNADLVPESSSIIDGQDVTWTSLQNVTIKWSVEYRVKWIQIVMGDTGSIKDVLVTIRNKNNNRSCIDPTVTKVNNVTTDILCNSWIRTTQIFIDFRTSKNVTSLHISGGRNLALKMATRQTSDYVDTERGLTFDSTRAVDGNPSGDFNGQLSCTHTEKHPVPSSWTVTFSRPQFVTRYVIYNRGMRVTVTFVDGNNGVRLKGFNLISYTPNNSAVFNHTDKTNSTSELIYNVTTPGKKGVSVSSIEIIAKNKDNYLTLCEVEVYGDQECSGNTYGLDCSSTCNCTNWKQCFVSTGQCHGGCVAGFYGDECSQSCSAGSYGENCSKNCSTNCTNQMCDRFNGSCLQCIPGRVGPFCELSCNTTFYGQNCTQKCSTNCTDSKCDNTDGKCHECIPGTSGDFCHLACDEHHYGTGCIYNCSSMCENSTCDKTNGICRTCMSGYQNDYCNSTCDDHHYGPGCIYNCSSMCENSTCDKTNGVCGTCISGYQDDYCNSTCNASFYGQNCTQKCSTNCTDSKCNNTDGKCHDCIPGTSGDFCRLGR
ncbi:uncharacterized protein LOC131950698 [Physella acuta]|uniref:uncharacterized protein LOC131950698 n=1 Tax=Physella acuta TaxID=109671 RepID=UPI0027DB0E48|nr:uncharacterized protein LOC131950698 [Physella acuta]